MFKKGHLVSRTCICSTITNIMKCMSCSKTYLATVLIRSIFAREKLHERFSAGAVFQRKIERINTVARHVFALITHLLSIQTTKSWKILMNNQLKAQSLNRKSYRKFTLSYFSVTCYKHVELLWPISALDRKQVRGYNNNIVVHYFRSSRPSSKESEQTCCCPQPCQNTAVI